MKRGARAARASCPTIAAVAAGVLASTACSVGTGSGSVTSDRLFVENCYSGPFNLRPNFFAANPFGDTLTIRVQRGERDIQESDGFTMLINDVAEIRENFLLQPLPLGLPVGVSPVGYGLPDVPKPPAASLSLYLNNSCRGQNSALYAVSGEVTFEKLFSGDPNEDNADARLTIGRLTAIVVDPSDAVPVPDGDAGTAYSYPPDRESLLRASFDFVFHRGTPAQPFP
jgi:hypothetical protein